MKVHESVQGNFACHETTRQIELLIKIVITLQETTYTSNTCVNRESTELLARSNFNRIWHRWGDFSGIMIVGVQIIMCCGRIVTGEFT